jgi:hypothetical protein
MTDKERDALAALESVWAGVPDWLRAKIDELDVESLRPMYVMAGALVQVRQAILKLRGEQ